MTISVNNLTILSEQLPGEFFPLRHNNETKDKNLLGEKNECLSLLAMSCHGYTAW